MNTPTPRVILHVGSHKTGTSTLQKFLRENRPEVEGHGVRFLKGWSKAEGGEQSHNVLATHLASGAPRQNARARACIAEGLDDLGAGTLLISSEEFNRFVLGREGRPDIHAQTDFVRHYLAGDETYWAQRALFIDRVAEVFSGCRVEIWATLRRPDNFCMSMYQQTVRNRAYVGTMNDFAASNFALFQYRRLLEQWARHFPVRVFVYEDLLRAHGDLTLAFLDALGLEALRARAETAPRVNTASHPHVIEFLRRTNYFPLDKAALRRKLGKVASGMREWPPAKGVVAMPPDRRHAFNDRFASDCAAIREAYAVTTPGRETLFDGEIDDERPVYPGMDQETYERLARAVGLVDPVFP